MAYKLFLEKLLLWNKSYRYSCTCVGKNGSYV